MFDLRFVALVLSAVLAVTPLVARAQAGTAPATPATPAPPTTPAEPEERDDDDEVPAAAPRPAPRVDTVQQKEREELRQEVLDEVRRELEKTREEIRTEVSYVESEADARNYDAEQLRELKQTVNLLQLHGYFRGRGDLFNKADLERGVDPAGLTLFPKGAGSQSLGSANMRLRLNPILRVSDDIALYSQIDVLDNVVAGSGVLNDPFFAAAARSDVLSSRIAGSAINVKRVWGEIETPVGQLAFGRMGVHFGEGLVYNDGNCLDCDYGTTFDRLQLTLGPWLNGTLFTLAVDALGEDVLSSSTAAFGTYGNFGQPFDVEPLDDAYRFSLQATRMLTPAELKRRIDDGDWVLQYGVIGAYRMQHSVSPWAIDNDPATTDPGQGVGGRLQTVRAQFGEVDVFAQMLYRKLRLATEVATLFGSYENRLGLGPTGLLTVFPGQSLDFLQYAGVLRAQYGFLKQDSLLISADLGIASGDDQPGMGARPSRPGSGPGGSTAEGDIDGPQYACGLSCTDNEVNNFRVNPDFRIDQLLWRNLFTTITDAWFVRVDGRFKLGGRASGGADDDGFEFSGALIYSQALNTSSVPGSSKPLGIEFDAAATYTSKDRFFAGLVGGFLLPFSGLEDVNANASLGQVYRLILGVTF